MNAKKAHIYENKVHGMGRNPRSVFTSPKTIGDTKLLIKRNEKKKKINLRNF